MQRTCSELQGFFKGCELKGDFGNGRGETGQPLGVQRTPFVTGMLVGVAPVTFSRVGGTSGFGRLTLQLSGPDWTDAGCDRAAIPTL